MGRLFVSHSSDNNPEARALQDWLRDEGWIDLFLDFDERKGIRVGTRWRNELGAALRRCDAMLVLLSPEWITSDYCLAEYNTACLLHKPIVACVVKPLALADIPATLTAEWQIVDLTAGARDYPGETPSGDEGPAAGVTFSASQLRRLKIGLMALGVEANHFPWPPVGDPDRRPYPGLAPLYEEDAGIYFGRNGMIGDALTLLRRIRADGCSKMMVILGASGAGKSSFMRAGLLPRLKRDDRHFFCLPAVRASARPLTGQAGLVTALVEAFRGIDKPRSVYEIEQMVEGGDRQVYALLTTLISALPTDVFTRDEVPTPTLVLPVDQGEELLAARTGGEPARFVRLLEDLLTRDAEDGKALPLQIVVLLTIRTDQHDAFQSLSHEKDIPRESFILPPMPIGEYGDVIRGPARRYTEAGHSLIINEDLINALLVDIQTGGAKDSLPLLAFTLQRMFHQFGGGGALTLEGYEKLGRIRGSISAAIERVMDLADADPRIPTDRAARLTLMRRGLIPWLAGMDPETNEARRRVARMSEIPAEARPLMDIMLEERLLSSDRDPRSGEITVEPAHEALLRQWSELYGWLQERIADFSAIDGVKRAASEWSSNDKRGDWLSHLGSRLKDAEDVVEKEDFRSLLEPTELEYLAACRKLETALEEQKLRSLRRQLGAATGTAVIAALAALFIFDQRQDALAARDVARSQNLLMRGNVEEAASIGLAAFLRRDNEETRSALLRAALEISPHLDFFRRFEDAMPLTVSWRSATSLAVATREGDLLTVADGPADTPTPRTPAPRTHAQPDASDTISVALYHAFGGDLRVLANGRLAFGTDSEPDLEASAGEARDWPLKQRGMVADADAQVRTIAAVTATGGTVIWTCESDNGGSRPACQARPVHADAFSAVTVSADGRRILAGGADGMLREIGGPTVAAADFDKVPTAIDALDLSGSGRFLAAASATGEVYVAALEGERKGRMARIAADGGRLPMVVWSPKRDELIYACGADALCLWRADRPEGSRPASLFGHDKAILTAVWSPDGERIATLDADRWLRVWTRQPDTRIRENIPGPDTTPQSFAFNRTSATAAVGDAEGRIWLLDGDGALTRWPIVNAPQELVSRLAWNRGGGLAALFQHTGFAAGTPGVKQAHFTAVQDGGGLEELAWLGTRRLALMPFLLSRIAIVDPNGAEPVPQWTLNGSAPPVGGIADASGDMLFVSNTDGSVSRLSVADRRESILVPPGQSGANTRFGMESLDISRDDEHIAFIGQTGNIEIVATNADNTVYQLETGSIPKTVAFSPSGNKLASIALTGELYIWHVADRTRFLNISAVPERSPAGRLEGGRRRAISFDWVDDQSIVLATGAGDLEFIRVDSSRWEERIRSVLRHRN